MKCLANRLEELTSEMLDFVKRLIEIPTVNPPGLKYKTCIDLIDEQLKKFGLETRLIEIPVKTPYPRYALLASFGEGEETIYFHGHYDVVPSDDEGQFSPTIREGKLFGRGACDMKGGLAAMIYAVRILQLCDVPLNGKICLVIVPDEETGGKYGSKYLFENGFIKQGRLMLMPEPTSGTIWNACRGAISLLLKIKGKAIHSTLHYQGINAFENMLKVAKEFIQLKEEIEKRKTSFEAPSEEGRKSILMVGGICKGGTNFNIVPGECSFSIDRRINPEEDLQKEKEELFSIINRLREEGINLEVEILQEGESAGIASKRQDFQTFASIVEMISGNKPVFSLCPGLLEIRYYIKNGTPAIAYGPGLLSVAHGPQEYVKINSLKECVKTYALSAMKLLSRKDS